MLSVEQIEEDLAQSSEHDVVFTSAPPGAEPPADPPAMSKLPATLEEWETQLRSSAAGTSQSTATLVSNAALRLVLMRHQLLSKTHRSEDHAADETADSTDPAAVTVAEVRSELSRILSVCEATPQTEEPTTDSTPTLKPTTPAADSCLEVPPPPATAEDEAARDDSDLL
eukprot:m.82057 g.82057  ORF g.82057 m.82057 type:complete len:170 (+) comp17611_c0_seq1:40-549(+)